MSDTRRQSVTSIGPATLVACLAVLCLSGAGKTASASESEELRERFREAYFAASTGAVLTDAGDDDALRAYVLYPYLQAARTAKALSLIGDRETHARDLEAAALLERYEGEPVADGLYRAWIESLARRGRHAELFERYREQFATTRVECQYLAARLEAGLHDGLAAAGLERWLTPSQLPIECEPVFAWLRSEGVLDEDWTERRISLLLENGQTTFAEIVARRLPDARAAPWHIRAALIESPGSAIDTLIAEPAREIEFDVLLAGFQRLAVADPDAGIARLERLIEARDLDRREASRLNRAIAYGLAWDRDERALDYFSRIDDADLDDYTLEWQARSALWAGDWPLVATSIEALSPALANETAWRYWSARAAAELGDTARSRAVYESILATDNFYSGLAAARLGREVLPRAVTFEADDDIVESLARLAPMVRARELKAVNLPSEALAEWRYAMAALTPEGRRQSIHVAADWGWYDVAVAAATSEGIFFDYQLLYPRPFDRIVALASRETRIDSALIYGVMRQESLFRPDAASGPGAVGLMQLVPETARRTASAWNRERPSREALFDPDVNVLLGAAHLRDLVDRFDGELAIALAAYNAGPGAADNWLPEAPVDMDIWIENIPYNETRAYVRRVYWHSLVFKWLEERRPQDTSSWLGRIEGRREAP